FDAEKVHRGEAFETALTYMIGGRSKIYAKYATVYRIPFIDEQASYYGFAGDAFYNDIEKEKGKSYEIGTQFYPLKGLMAGLTLYRIDMEDEIIYSGGRNRNFDKTRHEGIEADFSYSLKEWFTLFGNFTYHEATVEAGQYNGKEIPLVPTRMANVYAEIYLPCNFVLEPKVKYVSDSYQGGDNSNTSEKLDAYTLYDLFLYYRPQWNSMGFQAFFGIENLTDENYSTMNFYGGFYPEPGITWKGGLSFLF
ncbi:TonB-dependent receptor domain-containing protein, partial [Thermodesulfobacteriota bacterium]